ncbi:hypothetical protein DL770_006305 [Monosporascus sp. CRB-9-2]|nr:hypothetical protein DL770_006305 [Monosporascus sp. CRB-9-2]
MTPAFLFAALFGIFIQAVAFDARLAKRTEVLAPTSTPPIRPIRIVTVETTYIGGPERIFSTFTTSTPSSTSSTTPSSTSSTTPSSTSSTTPPPPSSTTPPPPDGGANTGAIVGGVVGGVGGIAFISLLAFYLIRRKNGNAQQPPQQYAPQQGTYPSSYYQDQNEPASVVNMGAVPGRNQSTSPGSQAKDNRDIMPPTSPTLAVHSNHPPSQHGAQQQHHASGVPPTVHEAGSNVIGQPGYLDNHHGQLHELPDQPDR